MAVNVQTTEVQLSVEALNLLGFFFCKAKMAPILRFGPSRWTRKRKIDKLVSSIRGNVAPLAVFNSFLPTNDSASKRMKLDDAATRYAF